MNRRQRNYHSFKETSLKKPHKADKPVKNMSNFFKNNEDTKEETSEPVSGDSEM